MKTTFAAVLMALLPCGAALAQTPIQATGSVQAGAAVSAPAPIAPTAAVSDLGINAHAGAAATADSGPQPWKDVMGWLPLKKGMREAEVLDLLGPDHHETLTKGGKLWTYQDANALLFGSLTFKDGQLENWTSPRF
jgi:hypothetical protein